ncbi:MAG: SUMF1/EgtB/PvdO family nonheme iron enzyme [Defluviicoccus sp.]|nr:SUMF1/EgtB/PvdO family nonheme iron enzyme [Defluviicoccus sp.]MDE0383263.1 SUMF1/EgtB/PvdO family nonheme iron enzyme [Defluviicoccus sp.]
MGRATIKAITATVVLLGASAAWADYDADRRHPGARQPTEAVKQWQAAAHAEDRWAMLALGRLYLHGLGVPQDLVLAHMWFTLASSRGEMKAIEERDALASRMTPDERAKAAKRAREWRPRAPAPVQGSAAERRTAGKPVATPSRPLSAQAVREAQRLLATLGHDPGPVDGKWGERATAAYRAFLRRAGRPDSDRLTSEGLESLRQFASAGQTPVKRVAPPARTKRVDLIRVVRAGEIDRTKAMLHAGADPDTRDMNGWTPLMHAADRGHAPLVRTLLDARADPDLRAADGTTALFTAVTRAHEKIAEILVNAGADISIKGPNSKTPLEVARLRGIEKTAALLAETAADHAAFRNATKLGTAEAYASYLASFRNGSFVQEAEQRRDRSLDREAFAKAEFSNTARGYRQYLSDHPTGEYRKSAEERVARLDRAEFNHAVRTDTVDAYESYMSMNPNGAFVGEAKSRRGKAFDRGEFERAKARNTIQAYEEYLTANPTGAHRTQARVLLKGLQEPIVIAEARSRNTVESYDAYLRIYPNGPHAEEVRRIRDRLYVVGKEFRDCRHCPELVVVPAGSFTMGSEDGDSDEQPPRVVTIAQPFAVGKYEVTVAEFRTFVQATKYDMSVRDGPFGLPGAGSCQSPRAFQFTKKVTWRNPGYAQTDDSPVVCVSWNDAKAFVLWLSQATGKPYRLLSEAEWEYVTRANTTSAFFFGDVISTNQANFNAAHSGELSSGGKSRNKALKVGSFKANDFGVYDTHGNVREWVEDCWHENYDGAPLDGSPWTSSGNCSSRVVRGGSWYHAAPYLRSAFRNSNEVTERHTHYGFRVGRAIDPTTLVSQVLSSKR